jgi:hypothetical protein
MLVLGPKYTFANCTSEVANIVRWLPNPNFHFIFGEIHYNFHYTHSESEKIFRLGRAFAEMLPMPYLSIWRWEEGSLERRVLFLVFPDIRKCISLFQGSQASPAYPSDKNSSHCNEDEYVALVNRYWQEKPEVLGEKPATFPLYPPQMWHGLARDRARTSVVGDWQLVAGLWPWRVLEDWKLSKLYTETHFAPHREQIHFLVWRPIG